MDHESHVTRYPIPFDRAPWMRHAACRGKDREMFFPRRGENVSEAKAVCATCPVKAECADYGLPEKYGVWGGLTDQERRVIRRERRREREAS